MADSSFYLLVSLLVGLGLGIINARSIRQIEASGNSDGAALTRALLNPAEYRRSLYVDYACHQVSLAVSLTALPTKLFKLDPILIDALRIVISCIAGAFGISLLTLSLGAPPFAMVLATVALLGSTMASQGYYLRAVIGTTALHGQIAPAFGTLVLALCLTGNWQLSMLGAGLLFSYHPVHGVIVSALVGAGLATQWTRLSFQMAIELIGWWLVGVLPLMLYIFWSRRTLHFHSQSNLTRREVMKWLKVRQFTTLFALSGFMGPRGFLSAPVPRLFGFAFLIICLGVTSLVKPDWFSGWRFIGVPAAAQLGAMLVVSISFYLLNVILVDGMQWLPAAPLAMSRATVYLVIIGIAVWATLAANVAQTNWLGLLVVALSIVMISLAPWQDHPMDAILSTLPLVLWIPFMDLNIKVGAGLVLFGLCLIFLLPYLQMVSVKAHLLSREQNDRLNKSYMAQVIWKFFDSLFHYKRDALVVVSFVISVSLGIFSIVTIENGAAVFPLPESTTIPNALLLVAAICGGVWHVFWRRLGFFGGPTMREHFNDWIKVQDWAREKTVPGSVFVIPPYLGGFEALSERTSVLGIFEMTFPLYVRSLLPTVLERIRSFGVNPLNMNTFGRGELVRALHDSYNRLDLNELGLVCNLYDAHYIVVEKETWRPSGLSNAKPLFETNTLLVFDSKDVTN